MTSKDNQITYFCLTFFDKWKCQIEIFFLYYIYKSLFSFAYISEVVLRILFAKAI